MSLFAKNADGTLKRVSAVTRPSGDSPRNPYASGYGSAVPSNTFALIGKRWQRVYVAIFSNSGSAWVRIQGERVLLDEREPETGAELAQVDKDFCNLLTGYIACMLWSTSGDYKGRELESLEDYSLAPATFDKCADDCRTLYINNRDDCAEAAARFSCHNDNTGYQGVGHDFWLTRNHHGAGFWDGDLPEAVGKRLTEVSHTFGELSPYLGDDKRVYL